MNFKAFAAIIITLLLVGSLLTVNQIGASPGWDGEIHIAVVGPRGWVQMESLWVGTTIAADLVNLGPNGVDDGGNGDDGIVVGGLNYKIVLQAVNSHAVELDPAAGWAELLAALEPPFSADFVIGGFRTECVAPMVAGFKTYAKDKNDTTGRAPIWFICGASTDELIDHPDTVAYPDTVRSDYLRGRYVFRNTPMNGTTLFKQLGLGVLRNYILPKRLYPLFGPLPAATYIIAEDLTWTLGMCIALAGNDFYPSPPYPVYPSPPSPYSVLGPQCDVVGIARTNPATGEGIEAAFDEIDTLNARLIIHIYSAVTGVQVVTTYRERLTNALLVGINVESQRQEFWDTSAQKCEYECCLNTVGTRTNINPTATPLSTEELWDEYYDKSDEILSAFYGTPTPNSYPVYTMWGAYGVIMELRTIIEGHGAWPISTNHNVNPDLISLIEQYDETTNGIVGKFKYTGPNPNYPYLGTGGNPTGKGTLHDLYSHPACMSTTWPDGYSRSLITQWQTNYYTGDGEMVVIWPQDQPYSRRYQVPPWVYDLETDLTFDGLVDIDDVIMPALAFGATPGSPDWDLEADLTADGLIDIDDVILVALDFGKPWPPWPPW